MKLRKLAAGLTALVMAGSLASCGGAEVPEELAGENGTTAADNAGGDASADGGDAASTDSNTNGGGTTPVNEVPVKEELNELYGVEDGNPIQLTCYSQLANYSGKLTGWFAEVLKREFNCEITIIPDTDGTFDTRMEAGNLGDIVVFGSNGDQYQRAATEGMLFDWNEEDLLNTWGTYTRDNMPYALENNMDFNESFLGEGNRPLYGFGHNVATSPENHEAFIYTWDIRWDLYKELGYPEVNNLDDLKKVLADMKALQPTDDNGNETYAISLWPDWDGNMVMYVKSFATAYWGYDEMGFGLYDTTTGTYHDALEADGPYLQSLKFFNDLYQADLVDPNSMTQTYSEMIEKLGASGSLFSIFNYAGRDAYNTEEHVAAGRYMYTMKPTEANPIAYGMNVKGGNRLWTIGASTEYPELCMAIINWLTTPEGFMTYYWGPKDVCWYYDDEGNTCFTELGEKAYSDRTGTIMPDEWGGGNFNDGTFQANNTTWSLDASNPDSNGETYNCINWKSRRTGATSDIQQDWMDHMGAYDADEYLETQTYTVAPATSYAESKRSDELKVIWQQVAECIVNYSWQAIYAKDDAEFDRIVSEMTQKCGEYDPNGECLAWCNNEASIRHALELEVTG